MQDTASPAGENAPDLSCLAGAVVLQVLPALETGGVERGTVEMVQALAGAGAMPLVASAGGRLVGAVRRAGGTHIALPLAGKTPWAIWRNAARLAQVIRAQNVALVHARSRAPAWAAWLACRRTGTIFMTTFHGAYGENFPGKRLYNSVMARGARVIAISQFIAALLRTRYGVGPGRLRVIPRGVDVAAFDPARVGGDRVQRLAAAWRLPDAGPIIMLPGRLTRWKGQEVLIDALAAMQNRQAIGVLVGADQGRHGYTRSLLARAHAAGLADRLRLVGQCDDMPAALALSDVVVSASVRPEAFGRVVIEAQAMRRMVIATDHGGAAETVTHDVDGWRVAAGNAGELARALDHVLALSAADRAEVGDAARASVLQFYTTRAMQDATLAVYAELLA